VFPEDNALALKRVGAIKNSIINCPSRLRLFVHYRYVFDMLTVVVQVVDFNFHKCLYFVMSYSHEKSFV
jgi:hypothetical protein